MKPSARLADIACMRALSIRQPYAELILRGVKTIEYRSRPTKIIGERFYIYAGKAKETQRGRDGETKWLEQADLPRGFIVGTAVIAACTPAAAEPGGFQWHLTNVKRFKKPRKLPAGVQPQPVWFWPFGKPAVPEAGRAARRAA